ncbi:MAG: hypothetical protein ACKVT0_14520 [Planctomycetaceae bacterium]
MGRPTFLDFLRRITGISTPILGVSWNPSPPERPIILRLFAQLGDRRVLFDSGCGVPRREMIDSATTMRENITEAVGAINDQSPGKRCLSDMRRACHQFQSFLEQRFKGDGYGGPEEDFYMAIGELRGTVGKSLSELCQIYRISIDEDVAKIIESKAPKTATT